MRDYIHSKALLIVDHGSVKEEANRMLEDVAELVRRQRPGGVVRPWRSRRYQHGGIARWDACFGRRCAGSDA